MIVPVRRFHSVEEMESAVWLAADDPRLARTIAQVWASARRMAPRRFPAGVYKHASIEDLNRLETEWESREIQGTART